MKEQQEAERKAEPPAYEKPAITAIGQLADLTAGGFKGSQADQFSGYS